MVSEGPKRRNGQLKRKLELAKVEQQLKGPKRKNGHPKLEQQLKRKRARSDKLQQRQGALFEDAGKQEVVFKKNKKVNLEGTEGEHELNPNDSAEISMDKQSMNPECRENGHSESSKKGQNSNGQQFSSKRCKKEQKSKSESSREAQQSHSKSIEKEDTLSIQGQELRDAKDNNEETLNLSMDVKEKKKKKSKKKRDRWGQVLNDAGSTHDTFSDDKDVSKPEDAAAHEDDTETLTEHESHKGEYDSKIVCVGGMPYDTSEEDILSFFKECGPVACVVCMKFSDTQRFKGLAFITFETETAASKALSLDGANMGDRLIKVEIARPGGKVLRAPPKREAGSLSVYVGNLDWNVQQIDIKRFFKGCDIDNVRLAVDKNTGDFRGYGHVDFSDEKSLEKAVEMNQKQLLGRPVKVSYAVPKGFKGKPS